MADHALAYLRVSTLAQEANGKNLESQLAEIRAYCAKQGYELAKEDVFEDVVSGARTDRQADRQGYYQLLARIERGGASVLCAYEVSRFGRNGVDNAWLLVKAKEYGLRVETVTGGRNFLADPESEFMFDILSAVAKYERTALMFRLIRGKKSAAGRGFWHSGYAPIGYDLVGPGGAKKLVPNQWAPLVLEAFKRYASGETAYRVAKWLRSQGTGRKWPTQSLVDVLRNPVYKGMIAYKGALSKGSHEAIVPLELWDKCQRSGVT